MAEPNEAQKAALQAGKQAKEGAVAAAEQASTPTPTQEENDLAKLGTPPDQLAPDGSPTWPPHNDLTPPDPGDTIDASGTEQDQIDRRTKAYRNRAVTSE